MTKARPAPATSIPASPGSVSRQIGSTAKRLRNSMGLTLGEVAKRSNISGGMLSRLENGDVSPSLETLAALTAALGVPLSNLFSEVGKARGDARSSPFSSRSTTRSRSSRVSSIPAPSSSIYSKDRSPTGTATRPIFSRRVMH